MSLSHPPTAREDGELTGAALQTSDDKRISLRARTLRTATSNCSGILQSTRVRLRSCLLCFPALTKSHLHQSIVTDTRTKSSAHFDSVGAAYHHRSHPAQLTNSLGIHVRAIITFAVGIRHGRG